MMLLEQVKYGMRDGVFRRFRDVRRRRTHAWR